MQKIIKTAALQWGCYRQKMGKIKGVVLKLKVNSCSVLLIVRHFLLVFYYGKLD